VYKRGAEWGNILRSVWPLLRQLVPLKRRCKYCIISEAYTPLIGGLCPDCLTQNSKFASKTDSIAPKGAQERLDALIRAHLSDAPYHALLMLSGGKDSAYILDRLRQEYPNLRLLCVTVNNGFMSPIAIKGAQHCAEKSHTDIIITNACINRFKHALKNAFLSLNGQGSYGVIDYTDGSLIFEVGKDIAKQLNIPPFNRGTDMGPNPNHYWTRRFRIKKTKRSNNYFSTGRLAPE
jgi:hypothetical protein